MTDTATCPDCGAQRAPGALWCVSCKRSFSTGWVNPTGSRRGPKMSGERKLLVTLVLLFGLATMLFPFAFMLYYGYTSPG